MDGWMDGWIDRLIEKYVRIISEHYLFQKDNSVLKGKLEESNIYFRILLLFYFNCCIIVLYMTKCVPLITLVNHTNSSTIRS